MVGSPGSRSLPPTAAVKLRPQDLQRTIQRSARRERFAEHEVDPPLVDQTAKAAKYAGWPLLLLLVLAKP